MNQLRATNEIESSGANLRDGLLVAASWLTEQAEYVNALNVFPVPDGDTGTNMSLTLNAAADALHGCSDDASAGEVAALAYRAALMGARGNSGVILSQLLRGFSQACEGKENLTTADLAGALKGARDVAYGGLSHPVEGTILTVATRAAEAALAAASDGLTVTQVLEAAHSAAREAVAETPNQLEVLRQAGVVDAGGEGYRIILEGVWMWSTGQQARHTPTPAGVALFDSAAVAALDEDPFGFCTEFLLQDCHTSEATVRDAMESLGQSVIIVVDGEILRVHLHTLRPGKALDFAVDHGTLAKVKVENMTLQHQRLIDNRRSSPPKQAGPIGVIAIAPGAGVQAVFESLGALVVSGGETMNPSIQQILTAVEASGWDQVIVLPNNDNIALTAHHVRDLATRPLEVVPTSNIAQGIAAIIALDIELSARDNAEQMTAAARRVKSVEVTRAVRDTEVGGLHVSSGQMLGILDGRIVAAEATAAEAALGALSAAKSGAEIITIYWGSGATSVEAQELAGEIRARGHGAGVEIVEGGQPHYPFIISLE